MSEYLNCRMIQYLDSQKVLYVHEECLPELVERYNLSCRPPVPRALMPVKCAECGKEIEVITD